MGTDRWWRGGLVAIGVLTAASMALAYPATDPQAENEAKQVVGKDYMQMIAGKPYKITPGEKPGTFNVSWGDESMVWEPKPWHTKSLKDQGPAVYDRWIQPDLPFPWEHTIAERLNYSGAEVHDRMWTPYDFNEYGANYITVWGVDLTSPDGTPRNKVLFEWCRAYRRDPRGLPDDQIGKVRAKYSFIFVAPDDYRGLGINTTIFFGDKFNEEYLYTPSSRKIRRLPQAARQDIIPGTIGRWEDFPQVKPFPDIDYKVVGYTLYKGQPDGTFGYSMDTEAEKINVGMDGIGEPCRIYEQHPHSSSYWYGKKVNICGIKSGTCWYETLYDHSGELSRTRVMRRPICNEDPRLQNKTFQGANEDVPKDKLEDWQTIWGGEHLTDLKSGFTMTWYIQKFWIDYDNMPRDIVNVENLTKEPVRKILFWE
ncbi:MAG: hypothetical protein AB7V27_09710 [Candidatus Binatia bacterium]